MAHKHEISDTLTLADQLLGLAKLHDSALKELWRTLYQTAPPARISSSLLLKAIAYRLQEQALGGLKSSTRRLLERVCGELLIFKQNQQFATDRLSGWPAPEPGDGSDSGFQG